MRYFISDLHVGHKNILKYDKRPFTSVEEMDEHIINSWNSRVNKKDIVYMVGDFSFYNKAKTYEIMERLKGNIILVRGNHDSGSKFTTRTIIKFAPKNLMDVTDLASVYIGGYSILVSHYPLGSTNTLTVNHEGRWMICGHNHNTDMPVNGFTKEINVCCNLWDYKPISEKEILQAIEGCY